MIRPMSRSKNRICYDSPQASQHDSVIHRQNKVKRDVREGYQPRFTNAALAAVRFFNTATQGTHRVILFARTNRAVQPMAGAEFVSGLKDD